MSVLLLSSFNTVSGQENENIVSSLFDTNKTNLVHKDLYTPQALQDFDLYRGLTEISQPTPPFSYGKYFLFIHYNTDTSVRVLISFAHENYVYQYPFIKLATNPNVRVFALPRTYTDQDIQYRIVVNNVWIEDYQNPSYYINEKGIKVSTVVMPAASSLYLPSAQLIDNNTIRFYLSLDWTKEIFNDTKHNRVDIKSISNPTIFLVGNFTAWNPFLIKMKPFNNSDTLFYTDIPARSGVFYYYYNLGTINLLDPQNATLAKRISGEYVNVIHITQNIKETTGAKIFEVSTMDIP